MQRALSTDQLLELGKLSRALLEASNISSPATTGKVSQR
jgi:hypothetical protein